MKSILLAVAIVLVLLGCNQDRPEEQVHQVDLPNDFTSIGQLLDSIHVEDQKYRSELDEIMEAHGWDSEEMEAQWEIISKIDSTNLLVVEEILDKYGWLSSDQIGNKANSALFLIIQHSDQQTQEKYLPMMRQAVEEGKANSRSLALLEDRVRLGKGELQVYGSQVAIDSATEEMYVLPLMEPERVNERRAKVGLGPIEDYVSHWGINWNVEEYKKKLPAWIEKQNQEMN